VEDLNSFTNKAINSRNVGETEEFIDYDGQIRSNTKDGEEIFSKLNVDFEELKFPGTVPDLELEIMNYGKVFDKCTYYVTNPEDDEKDIQEKIMPEEFNKMLIGQKGEEIEKVVYFSTLNSQDKVVDNTSEEPHSQPITKYGGINL
jgi:hypothetical protein